MNPAVIGTDVVERQVVNGVLHTSRLVSSTWYFPKWAQAVSAIIYTQMKPDSILSTEAATLSKQFIVSTSYHNKKCGYLKNRD